MKKSRNHLKSPGTVFTVFTMKKKITTSNETFSQLFLIYQKMTYFAT
jgi:hypothetical protein